MTTTNTVSRPAVTAGRGTALTPAEQLYPENRRDSSERKIRAPFVLDPTLCLYSPQTNLDSMQHPRVIAWHEHVVDEWTPTEVPGARSRIALLLPCTKYKPYFTSREHRAVNSALLAAGWAPTRAYEGPAEILDGLEPHEHPELFNPAPLTRDGIVLDRFVISEPLGLVPYEEIMYVDGEQSPASSYDDPGLFESRGTSVSPERDDCTATLRSDGTWSWGPEERQAYAVMHNQMTTVLVAALGRLAPSYSSVTAWVSPGLTHRSFLADTAFRVVDGIHLARRGTNGEVPLVGVLDSLPGAVTILPTAEQSEIAKEALRMRLESEGRSASPASVRSRFARGDGNDTPLGLPEMTAQLVTSIDAEVAAL